MPPTLNHSPIPMVEEEEANGQVGEIYQAIKRDFQMPAVPNMIKMFGASPPALAMYYGIMQSYYSHLSIPHSLASIISYTVAEHSHCEYCSAINELACRNLGIDEETLALLANDLGNVNPERVRAVIEFALKVAKDPQGVGEEDFEKVRNQGVSDEDIVEITLVAGIAVCNDIIADTLKIPVDTDVAQALGR